MWMSTFMNSLSHLKLQSFWEFCNGNVEDAGTVMVIYKFYEFCHPGGLETVLYQK